MNPAIDSLHAYPFQKLAHLMQGVTPPPDKNPIVLSIGEPRHPAPDFVKSELMANAAGLSAYPYTRGTDTLRAAIASWANRRYRLRATPLDPARHVVPTCGSREALFSVVQSVVDPSPSERPVIMMPNPFYQIYEGAALMAGAEPVYLNTHAADNFIPDLETVSDATWRRTQLIYLCSPGNPTGAVLPVDFLARLLEIAEQYDFIVASDECYSEIYFDEQAPPAGLLQVAHELGIEDHRRCLVFQSLSKRSNLPGLRSGFVAGDAKLIQPYLHYRTYHGCTPPSLTQALSVTAWRDEAHVQVNRARYREKFAGVLEILRPVMDVEQPDASFYLWPRTPIDDEDFARGLLAQENVTVLPGSYLSRESGGMNPGRDRVRMALVGELDECIEAAHRIRVFVESL